MKFVLDAGHGGIAWGHYLTRGKRSPKVPPGIYEGAFNRAVCSALFHLDPSNLLLLNNGPINVKLGQRVKYVNQLSKLEHIGFISIHANASRYWLKKPHWTEAHGATFFVSRPCSAVSLDIANSIYSNFIELPIMNREIKQRNFTVLKRTRCPAVLVECGFMTNKSDALYLASSNGVNDIAHAIYNSVRRFI